MRNELLVNVWIFVDLSLTLFGAANGGPCTFNLPCSCSSPGFMVDLYPLMFERQKPFSAPGIKPKTYYYLNPCGEHLTVSSCQSLGKTAAGCQVQEGVAYGIAKTTGYTGAGDPYNGTVHFTYSFNERKTILAVKCSTSFEEFTFLGENPKDTYAFLLKTRYACQSLPGSHGLSLGSVLLIIFFVVLAIYFIGGCLFQNFVRNAQGLEVIPNYEFWKDLPVLIKDGMMFTFQKFKRPSTYEQI